MYSRKRRKDTRWAEIDGGAAFVIPVTLLQHANFKRLSAEAIKMLLDLGRQYTGSNNGYQCAAWTLSKDWGWRSESTVRDALAELEHHRIIVRTQQGGRNRPNLYGFTWRRIDAKPEKPLDLPRSSAPSNDWKNEQQTPFARTSRKRKSSPSGGAISTPQGANVRPQRGKEVSTTSEGGAVRQFKYLRLDPSGVT